MKVIGLDDREYSLSLSIKQRNNSSGPHKKVREILKSIFPFDKIFEEVSLPGFGKITLYADFLIPSKSIMVEIDGIQHGKYIPFFHQSKLGFSKYQGRDKLKSEFCEINNITLIRLSSNEEEDWINKINNRNNDVLA